jgi:antitoxin component YwqK of YwqJK toxin-antitoxin module
VKKHFGSIVLIFMIFLTVIAGYMIIRYYYTKKTVKSFTRLETIQTRDHGDISVERYYKNGKNIKALGFYKDGSKKSEYYVNDDEGLSTKYITYYPNGQIENRMERWVEGPENHYIDEEFLPDGRLRKREGTKISRWEYYDDDGNPTLMYVRDGERIVETLFYPGGKKQEECEYLSGKRDGKLTEWDSTGVVTKIELYKNGIRTQ